MLTTDTTNRPYRLFIIGLLTTTTLTLLLYKFTPTYNLFGGQWSVYLPGQATAQAVTDNMRYTNTDILITLGIYNLVYWSFVSLAYAGLQHLTRIRFQSRDIKVHFTLSLLAFVFVICLNNKVTFVSTYFNSGPSDIYISGDLSKVDMSQINNLIQFRTSLTSPTSLIGIGFLVLGMGLFLVNIYKGLKRFES
jgi:hypothetical protein